MTPSETADHLRLARAEGVGPVTYRRLLRRFQTPTAALDALPDLARAGGRRAAPRVPSLARAEEEVGGLARMGGRLLVLSGPDYPSLLALADDAPPVIAVLGAVDALAAPAVGLVGGRNASTNGRRMADALARSLAERGFAVVSGMARGVDAAAHRGALAVGRTVAAVAGGLDRPYPREHAPLQSEIVATGGAVVAEAPLGTAPQARHFPRRNRVIAGLSLGVVVVEAAPRSGSLITARLAHDYGRELFAVPGSPLDPRCHGSNDLIRQGAHLTEGLADVLDNLPDHPSRVGLARAPLFARGPIPAAAEPEPFSPAPEPPGQMAEVRRQVVELVGPSPTLVDDLIRDCQFSPAAVMATLLELELAGRVETIPGNRVMAVVPRDGP